MSAGSCGLGARHRAAFTLRRESRQAGAGLTGSAAPAKVPAGGAPGRMRERRVGHPSGLTAAVAPPWRARPADVETAKGAGMVAVSL